jgi:hypothetical protein
VIDRSINSITHASPRLDRGPGLRRARAAILLMLDLPEGGQLPADATAWLITG